MQQADKEENVEPAEAATRNWLGPDPDCMAKPTHKNPRQKLSDDIRNDYVVSKAPHQLANQTAPFIMRSTLHSSLIAPLVSKAQPWKNHFRKVVFVEFVTNYNMQIIINSSVLGPAGA